MSERGSFVTEYIYCDDCFWVAKDVLRAHADLCCEINDQYPIISGKIKGDDSGQELHTFELFLVPALAPRLCHRMRIAVLAEHGEQVFTVEPTEGKT